MIGAFEFLKVRVSDPFNQILGEAKLLLPRSETVQAVRPLALGPPHRAFDLSDIDMVPSQFQEAVHSIAHLRLLLAEAGRGGPDTGTDRSAT